MSSRRGKKHKKSGKKLAYGVIAVIFILLCFATYSFLHQPNQTDETNDNESNNNQFSYKAAIVDHLSLTAPNQAFKNSSISILEAAGFDVTYYPGENVTVNFYKNLVSHNYDLIVLRVHSALIGTTESLGLFTSEHYDPDNIPPAYYEDIPNHLVEAYFTKEKREQGERYFAISPEFIEKYGNFQNTTIMIMGCDGLKYNTMAEAFRRKGAKVCIGWDGLVSSPHTDRATTCLLQHLAGGNTVNGAVENTMTEVGAEEMYFQDQGYNSTLKYYPIAAGGYEIKHTRGISDIDAIGTNTVLVKKRKKLN